MKITMNLEYHGIICESIFFKKPNTESYFIRIDLDKEVLTKKEMIFLQTIKKTDKIKLSIDNSLVT